MMKKVVYVVLGLILCLSVNSFAQKWQKSITKWEELGPDNIGGRTRAILIDKDNSSKIYAGSAAGGLWVSLSGGSVWSKVKDFPETIAISSLVQIEDGTIFVGTGEGLNPSFSSPGVLSSFGVYGKSALFGMEGAGIYKYVNDSFELLGKTESWKEINKMAYDPISGNLYAATDYGLQISKDKGQTWAVGTTTDRKELNVIGIDVKVASDGTVIYVESDRSSNSGKAYISSNGAANSFKSIMGETQLPASSGRIEVAFSPSDPNYVYASVSEDRGGFLGIYQSKNKGETFRLIVPGGGVLIDVFNGSGHYCNAIAVYPDDPGHILVGGYPALWEGTEVSEEAYFSFKQITSLSGVHTIVFDPKNESQLYIGSNIGVISSKTGGASYNLVNKNYNVTQFTTIACANDGRILGGTRDNGTLYIDGMGNTAQTATQLTSGYGGQATFSMLNTNAMFYTSSYGTCYRKASPSTTAEEVKDWYDETMRGGTEDAYTAWSYQAAAKRNASTYSSSYVSPILLWETAHDPNSTDTVIFKADKSYKEGEMIYVRSKTNNYPMMNAAPKDLEKGEELSFIDHVQNRFFLGGGGYYLVFDKIINNRITRVEEGCVGAPVFMAIGALDFTAPPTWYRVFFTGDTSEQVTNMCISTDGNHLFISTYSYEGAAHNIYRISGFNYARDSISLVYGKSRTDGMIDLNESSLLEATKIYSTYRFINSITLDPQNSDILVVTMGENDPLSHIFASTNATTATEEALDIEANSKEGTGFPDEKMPIYTALVEMENSDVVYVGTEKGVFICNDFSTSSPSWEPFNIGIDAQVPVFMLKQQTADFATQRGAIYGEDSEDVTILEFPGTTNTGCIYAATHGRGVFVDKTYWRESSIKPLVVSNKNNKLVVFPNPTKNNVTLRYSLLEEDNLTLNVYDINGKRVMSKILIENNIGENNEIIDCSALKNGFYFIKIQGTKHSFSAKLSVIK